MIATLMSAALVGLVAAPAVADVEGKVKMQSSRIAAVVEGSAGWVQISWQADRAEVTDFRVTATAKTAGVGVAYPTNTGTYTSLMDDATLSDGEIDFTSLYITAPYDVGNVLLKLSATWVEDGKSKAKDYTVTVPIAKYNGDDLAQATVDAGAVSVSAPAWLGVEWTGLAPTLDDIKMTVSEPEGAAISYPTPPGSYTSLHYNDTLTSGETDVARFRIDASGMAPGAYTIDLLLAYTKGTESKSVTGQVTFTVTG